MSENKLQEESFYKYLISNGYYFDKELIENYLLSLKVKPFEILTGNSGTGKTKLSQLFASYVGEYLNLDHIDFEDDGFFTLKVKANYSSWENRGWTLRKEEISKIIPINECGATFDMKVDNIPAKGNINVMIQLFYDSDEVSDYFKNLYNKNPNSWTNLKISCEDIKNYISKEYIEPNGKILLKQNSNKSAYDKRQWFVNKSIFEYYPFDSGYFNCNVIVNGMESTARIRGVPKLTFKKNDQLQNYLRENDGKEVNLELSIDKFDFDSFISKWGSQRIELLDCYENDDSKYQIVPVGANWTDNTNIVGYYNVITEDYQSTPAYELIEKAQNDPENPYFLILDEMNLSHVERYFADFLSAIESGEEIPLYGNNETLLLPKNLFIIGTVNVDETTYMFSPKVLDRANTIEFNTLTAWEYMSTDLDESDFEGNINYLQSPLIDSDISDLNIEELKEILSDISCNDDNLWDILAIELTAFQETLKDSSFDFGFRVINEILRFMVVAWRYENEPDEWDNWERYFDAQIKQKILPKLHGSEKAIGNVLTNLFNICLEDRNSNENPKNYTVSKENSRYYTSALKLQNMSKVLSDQRYVSFIN
ncbi:McrB family protein [Methanobrevibacter sp.]|uniref:McrB family protein n=1 Tax=Methanobrevibacter sp. TaxID=66852 RepID=UPI0025D12403|nr:hypothetical protein [Methanobrevibacter sp.]MBR4447027.1 hypothetical protein [Methanobrevibacter sp.]